MRHLPGTATMTEEEARTWPVPFHGCNAEAVRVALRMVVADGGFGDRRDFARLRPDRSPGADGKEPRFGRRGVIVNPPGGVVLRRA